MKSTTPEKVKQEILREHYRKLGKKGAKARLERSTKAQRRAWGKKGGRPPKVKL